MVLLIVQVAEASNKPVMPDRHHGLMPTSALYYPYCVLQASTLGNWFTGLLQRHDQLGKWLTLGRPRAYWLTGFFNPQVPYLQPVGVESFVTVMTMRCKVVANSKACLRQMHCTQYGLLHV